MTQISNLYFASITITNLSVQFQIFGSCLIEANTENVLRFAAAMLNQENKL